MKHIDERKKVGEWDSIVSRLNMGGTSRRLNVLLLVFVMVGCIEEPTDDTNNITSIHQALVEDIGADSCGYEISAELLKEKRNGDYRAVVTVTNVSGIPATDFEILLDIGSSTIKKGKSSICTQVERKRCRHSHGKKKGHHSAHSKDEKMKCHSLGRRQSDVYTEVDGGYLIIAPEKLDKKPLEPGDSYRFKFKGEGPFEHVNAYLVSINGTACDSVAPEVTLNSPQLVTAAGPVTLTADINENVGVWKVVFEHGGEVIGEDREAPFTVDVDIDDALNGLQIFTAKAVDPAGNEGVDDARMVVAIDNRFFGTAPGDDNSYIHLLDYFNQITPENAGKWESIEATRDEMDWSALDTAYSFAKDNGLPFKFHTLVWGKQQPGWLVELTPEEQLAELDEFMAAVAERYPDIDMIDVVNEPLHAPPVYKDALGGDGETGWDWVIKAFEMAMGYFPNAILMVNDYNIVILEDLTASYMPIITLLQERGLIDAIGVQGHFLEQADPAVVAANLTTLASTGMGVYVSEFDINYADDARQAVVFGDLVTVFYDNPSMLGVTAWGHLKGAIWRQNAYLIDTDGNTRPALDWLVCFLGGGQSCVVPEYIPQPREGDSSNLLLEVETYDEAEGLVAIEGSVAYTGDGSWMNLKRVVFDDNWDLLSVTYAKGNEDPASLTFHLDSLESAPVATVDLPTTGSWGGNDTLIVPWAPVSGEKDLFVKFNGANGVANVDKVKFSAPEGMGESLISGDFEEGSSGWFSWGDPAPTVLVTDARAFTGTKSLLITDRAGNNPAAIDLLNSVEPGVAYQTTFWVSIGGADSASVNVTEKIKCVDGATDYIWLGQVTVTGDDWVEIAGLVEIPDCTLETVQLYAEGPAAGVDLYVDHVSMRAPIVDDRVNILSEGTFEDGSIGAWETWKGGTIAVTDQYSHGGDYSLIITDRADNAPAAYDVSEFVHPGVTYDVSFWVSILGAPSAKVNVTKAVTCDGSTSYNWVEQVSVAEGAWTEISGSILIPDCDTVGLKLWAEGDLDVDLLVDDAVVLGPAIIPEEPDLNLMPNGYFETDANGWYSWNGSEFSVTSEAPASAENMCLVSSHDTELGPAATSIASVVEPGKTYEISTKASIGGADNANVFMQVALNCGSGTDYPTLGGATISAGVWETISGEIAIPEDCDLSQVQLQIQGNNIVEPSSAIYLYLDDVTLLEKEVITEPEPEIVFSADFEDGQQGPWYSWSGSATVAVTDVLPHSGTYSLSVTDSSLANAVVQMNSLLEPNVTYSATYWVTIEGADSVGINVVNTADCGVDDPQYVWFISRTTVNAGEWTELTGTYTVPDGCTLQDAQFYVEGGDIVNAGDTITLYVDDVVITK